MKFHYVAALIILATTRIIAIPLPGSNSPAVGDTVDGFKVIAVQNVHSGALSLWSHPSPSTEEKQGVSQYVKRATPHWWVTAPFEIAEAQLYGGSENARRSIPACSGTLERVETRSVSKENEDFCESPPLHCSGSNRASEGVCHQLLDTFKGNDTAIPVYTQSVCLRNEDEHGAGICCISWADKPCNARYQDLLGGAETVVKKCAIGTAMMGLPGISLSGWDWNLYGPFWGHLSGTAPFTKLGSSCTTLCVSNRPTHCTNPKQSGLNN